MKYKFYLNEESINDRLRITYLFDISKEEFPIVEMLPSILIDGSMNYQNSRIVKKKLFENYDTQFYIQALNIGNKGSLSFIIECINKELLPNKEDVLQNILDMIIDLINNNNLLCEDFDLEKLSKLKRKLRKSYINSEYSLSNVIDEINADDEEYINNVNQINLESIKNLYKRIVTNSKIFVQYASREENKKVKVKIQKYLKYGRITNKKLTFPVFKFEDLYYRKISKKETPSLCYMIQDDQNKISSKRMLCLDILSSILDKYMFEKIRTERSLSYNPNAFLSFHKNAIVLSANIQEENKDLVIEIIDNILEEVLNGNINNEYFYEAKKSVYQRYDKSKMNCEQLLGLEIENYILSLKEIDFKMIDEIQLEDIIKIAKNFKTKLIYFLGGK